MPVPCVNPSAPYSIVQLVSVAPAVQLNSAELDVELVIAKSPGGKHDGGLVTTISKEASSSTSGVSHEPLLSLVFVSLGEIPPLFPKITPYEVTEIRVPSQPSE